MVGGVLAVGVDAAEVLSEHPAAVGHHGCGIGAYGFPQVVGITVAIIGEGCD